MDPVLPLVVSLALAALWLVAAWHKLTAFSQFVSTLSDYRLLPEGMTNLCGVMLIAVELGLGSGLVVPAGRSLALTGSAALLLVYAAAMAINLFRGRRHIDCGCMGPAARQSLSGWLLTRNLLLAFLALACLSPTQQRPFVWLDTVSVAAAVGALALIYGALNHLIANAPNFARLRR